MKVARTDDCGNEEEEADPSINRRAHGQIHEGLAEGAQERQHVAHKVELGNLVRPRHDPPRVPSERMEGDIEPTSDRVVGRVLPRLEAISMGKVVRRFPIVEGFVAVLDRGEQGRHDIRGEEEEEGLDGRHGIDARSSRRHWGQRGA